MSVVAEEHDIVSINCIMYFKGTAYLEKNPVFSVCYGYELGVPRILDQGVIGLKCQESKSFVLTPSNVTKDELKYFAIESIISSEYTLSLTVYKITKVKEFWNLSEEEKKQNAQILKLRGNALLQEKEYTKALAAYKIGIRTLEGSVSVTPTSDHSDPKARAYLISLLTNAALCLLKLQQNMKEQNNASKLMNPCLTVCKKSVDLDPQNVKAWYRMGQAFAVMQDYTEAIRAGENAIKALDALPEGRGKAEIEAALQRWRSSESRQQKAAHKQIHRAFLQRAAALQSGRIQYEDDDNGVERVEISQWSNGLAENMMSIHEELEAFGETMPEAAPSSSGRRSSKNLGARGRNRLAPIDDLDTEEVDDSD